MSKQRSGPAQPPNRKGLEAKAKLSARNENPKSSAVRSKSEAAKGGKVRLHQNDDSPAYTTRPIPWWVEPESQRSLPGAGLFPPGPGPGGPFPPGPGPFPPGPGPFPPGPGPFPPGPGPFPPGPGPFPPGPGPFPPGPGPFPPGPGPFPPGPGPFPPGLPFFITVRIFGGALFPWLNTTNFIPFYPGITIRQSLESTGLVGFGPGGFIRTVAGIRVGFGSNIDARVRYNGRVIPQTLLGLPAQPGSTIALELIYSALPLPVPL